MLLYDLWDMDLFMSSNTCPIQSQCNFGMALAPELNKVVQRLFQFFIFHISYLNTIITCYGNNSKLQTVRF